MILTYNDVGIEVNGVFFPVENASFSTQSTAEPRRKPFSTSVPARWGHSGPQKSTLSLKGKFIPECASLLLNKTGEVGFDLSFGGMMCKNVQINSFRYVISPFSPITFETSLTVYGEVSGAPNGTFASSSVYPTGKVTPYRFESTEDIAHGLFSNFSGFQSAECLSNPFSISVSYDFDRDARIKIGSRYPDRVALRRAEKTIAVDGDGWDGLISFKGSDVTGSIGLSPSSEAWGLGFSDNGAISGHAFAQQLGYIQLFSDLVTEGKIVEQSLQTDSILKGGFTVKEVLY